MSSDGSMRLIVTAMANFMGHKKYKWNSTTDAHRCTQMGNVMLA
jgi:hypothetical protein